MTHGPVGIDNNPGEERATVNGVTFARGDTLLLRPGTDRDVFDRMLEGDGDARAALHRLRGRRPHRRDRRRRPGPGALPRDRPLPVLLRRGAGGL